MSDNWLPLLSYGLKLKFYNKTNCSNHRLQTNQGNKATKTCGGPDSEENWQRFKEEKRQ